MPMPPPALSAIAVSKRYGAVTALDAVTLEIADGECVALVGESGSGKSTLLRAFNGLTTVDAGEVAVQGTPLAGRDLVALRRSLGFVPQDGGLLPHWSVARNVGLVPALAGRADAGALADAALVQVGLDPAVFASRWPHQLSGGQRQRVAFARAMAANPRILLLDEPFGALDAITRTEVQAMFARLRAERGVAALLVTHDLHEAFELADRVGVMRGGRLEQLAPPRALVAEPSTAYVADLLARARITGAPR